MLLDKKGGKMNLAAIIGLLFSIAIGTYSILESTKSPKLFLNGHAIIIVIGGTLTVGLLSFPFARLFAAFKIVVRKVFGREKLDYLGVIKQIVEISIAYRNDPKSISTNLTPKTHPFLMDGIKLIADYGFSAPEIDAILENSVAGKKKRDREEVKVWHTLSRFPPAFGLLGATLGMISLLETLGEPGSQDRIGPAMATALVATFYGLMAANLVFIPIAERLAEVSSNDIILRNIIKRGVILVAEKKHPSYIDEYLNSFLPPGARASTDKGPENVTSKGPLKA